MSNYKKSAESAMRGSARNSVSEQKNGILKGIGYALLHIGEQLGRLADAQEQAFNPHGKPNPGEDLETK